MQTEGLKYIGSKLKIIPYILEIVKQTDTNIIFDAFSGTTRVSQAFAQQGYSVTANDISVWSEIFAKCYLLNNGDITHYKQLIDHLNNIPEKTGFFTENYGGFANEGNAKQNGLKKLWQIHNTKKLDAIRIEIDNLNLSEIDKAVALVSLMLALDRVDNTCGHFTSYLKKWSARSYKTMMLQVPKLIKPQKKHKVYCKDIFDIANIVSSDLVYLDPPYGSNSKMPSSRVRYAAYYHIWTTICKNDNPILFGKAKRRVDTKDTFAPSLFEDFREKNAEEAIKRLVSILKTKYILFSYNNNGTVLIETLRDILKTYGTIEKEIKFDYNKNVMSKMQWTKEWANVGSNMEYLFLIKIY